MLGMPQPQRHGYLNRLVTLVSVSNSYRENYVEFQAIYQNLLLFNLSKFSPLQVCAVWYVVAIDI